MLNGNNIFIKGLTKIIPDTLQPKLQSWALTWKVHIGAPSAALVLTSPLHSPEISVLRMVLVGTSAIAAHAGAVAWLQRGEKEWTLPHESWKTGCLAAEEKFGKSIAKPHLYRLSALRTLSEALKKNVYGIDQLHALPGDSWEAGYRLKNKHSVMLATPQYVDLAHTILGFDKDDVARWIEAAYLDTIYNKLEDTMLPGTKAFLLEHINANCAAPALQWTRVPEKMRDAYKASPAAQSDWFHQSQWCVLEKTAEDIRAQLNDTKPMTPMQMYRYFQKDDKGLAIDMLEYSDMNY